MKKIYSFLLALVLTCLSASSAWAQTTFTENNLLYVVRSSTEKTVALALRVASGTSDTSAYTGAVSIPSTVTHDGVTYTVIAINTKAFKNSTVTSVTIPATVTTIGEAAFDNTYQLKKLTFSDASTPISIVTRYYLDFGDAAKELYVGRDLTFTGDYTGRRQFNNVTKATFGGKATAISDYILDGATTLKTLTIGSSVKTIGQYAFRSCGTDESITEMTVSMGTAVTTMGRNAFDRCSKLKSITLPTTLREIPERAFYATGLTALTIPANVTSIGYQAFNATDALTSVHINDASTTLTLATNYYRDFGTAAKELYVGRNLTFTGDYTRRAQFEGVTKATLGGKMTTINDFMLEDNKNLATLVIGNNVTRIGTDAFQYCGQDVEELKVTMGTKVQAMDGWTFQSCSTLKSITLPATLKTIGQSAFHSSGLTAVTIPASVDSIGYQAFHATDALASVRFDDAATPVKLVTNNYVDFGTADKELYVGRDLTFTGDYTGRRQFDNVTKATFGGNATAIAVQVLDGNAKLKTLTIGASVKTIGQYAFRSCGTDESITEMTVSMGTAVTTMGRNAFDRCSKLKSITLPTTLREIPEQAFYNTGLTALTIPANVTSIGYQAFNATDALANIHINDASTTLTLATSSYRDFGTAAKELYVGRNLTFTGDYTGRRQFDNVKEVSFGALVTAIPAKLFEGSTQTDVHVSWLTPITIASSVFSGDTYQQATLWVPGGTMETYENADVWKLFVHKDFGSFLFTIKSDNGGTIALGDVSVKNGTKTTLVERGGNAVVTLTPATGYELNKVTVGGVDKTSSVSGGKLTLTNVQAEATVSATFKLKTFTITKAATTNGTITLSATTVQYNKSYTVTFAPATGYELATVSVNGTDKTSSVSDNKLTVTNVKENQTVSATFQKQTYAVSITATGGQVTASTLAPKYQDNVVLTIVEDEDSELQKLMVNGTDVTSRVSGGKYTITKVTGNVTVVATFRSNKEYILMSDSRQMFSCTEDLDFTGVSGLKAYIASGYDASTGAAIMTQVQSVPANTGLLLIGTKGTTYKVPYATSSAFYVNLLLPVSAPKKVPATEGSYTNFLFTTQDGVQAFFKADGTKTLTAGSAYLSVPTTAVASVKRINVVIGETVVGIDDLNALDAPTTPDAAVYDLGGRKVADRLTDGRLPKGIYVVRGKKVVKK